MPGDAFRRPRPSSAPPACPGAGVPSPTTGPTPPRDHGRTPEDIARAAAYDAALLDIFWTAMAGYAHALAVARAEGITARELAPFAQGIGAILPPIFEATAGHVDDGTFSGEDNPLTSTASSLAHIVATAETHGIDSAVIRAAEGQVRRAIGLGHGTDGFTRVSALLGPH